MLIIPYVCAEFHDKTGAVIHRIRPADLRLTSEAPDAIQQDPLFAMMVSDGTLKVPESKSELKKLENDPDAKAPVMKVQEKTEDTGSAAPADEKKSGRKSAENK